MPNNNGTLAHLALDGPSALAFYRDRAVEIARGTPDSDDLDVDDAAFWFNDASNGWLSDEDVAASLAQTSVFGFSTDFETVLDAPGNVPLPTVKKSRARALRSCAFAWRDLKNASFDDLGIRPPSAPDTLYVLVPEKQQRRVIRWVRERSCSVLLPERALYLVEGIAYVPTPEFLFVLMAHYLSVPGLMMLAMELCGHYRLVGAETTACLSSNSTLYGQTPLTSVARLREFVDRAEGFYGIAACRRALSFVADGSASPMETILYLLLCAPCRLGGYGLRQPILNARMQVSSKSESITSKRHLVPDLYWPQTRLDMEYDSEEFHTDPSSMSVGARRTLALQTMNVQVVTMTYDVLRDYEAFDAVARAVMRRLGQRLPKATQELRYKQIDLRNALLHGEGLYRLR